MASSSASGQQMQVLSNAMDAADDRKVKKARVLKAKSTDEECNKAIYDNFTRKGWSRKDTDIIKGSDGQTARAVVRQRIHDHHRSQTQYPLGANFYNEVKESHPRAVDQAMWPQPPANELCRAGLYEASVANQGAVMRKRGFFLGEVEKLTNANRTESITVAKFLLRLSYKNETMVTESMIILDWAVRDKIKEKEPAVWNQMSGHLDDFLVAARKKAAGLTMRARPWVLRHRARLLCYLRSAVIDKLLAVEEGNWSSAKAELLEASKCKIGQLIWGSHLIACLSEEVNTTIWDRAMALVKEKGMQTVDDVTTLINLVVAEVEAMTGLENLPKTREALIKYGGYALVMLVQSIIQHVKFSFHAIGKCALLAHEKIDPLWCEDSLWASFKEEFIDLNVSADAFPGTVIVRDLCKTLIIAPFTTFKIQETLKRKASDCMSEDDTFVIEQAFWQQMFGKTGTLKMVNKVMAILPSSNQTRNLSSAHQMLGQTIKHALMDFIPQDVQTAVIAVHELIGHMLLGNAPNIPTNVTGLTQQFMSTIPFFCYIQKDDGTMLRGKLAFQEMMNRLDAIDSFEGLEPYMLYLFLGTAEDSAAVHVKKDELVEKSG